MQSTTAVCLPVKQNRHDVAVPWTSIAIAHVTSNKTAVCLQCFRFSRNISQVTPKITCFHYLKKYFLDQSIQNVFYFILLKEELSACSALAQSVRQIVQRR